MTMDALQPGMLVEDISDINVGVVREVEDWGFLVRVADGPDELWLLSSAIFTVQGPIVTLVCNKKDISRYQAQRDGRVAG